MRVPRVLIVAGSDSGGGAGIQADIKTVMALGGHATTAITAITAQNTLGVSAILPVPADIVVAQMTAVLDDIGADAVKIGMLGSAEIARAVGEVLAARCRDVPIVVDPVLVATSGAVLGDAAVVAAMAPLFALARIVTPNVAELERLTDLPTRAEADRLAAARVLAGRTGAAVLAKGGHGEGALLADLLVPPAGAPVRWEEPRIETRHTHGTGCTLASGIATGLGRGLPLEAAVAAARAFVRAAILAAPGFGAGHGPMGHGLTGQA